MAKTLTAYLVITATGDIKVRKNDPSRGNYLNLDEVWFRVRVTVPDSWGKRVGDIELTIPEGSVTVDAGEWDAAISPRADG